VSGDLSSDFPWLHDSDVGVPLGRLWNLRDIMINYRMFGLYHLWRELWTEEVNAEGRIRIMEFNKVHAPEKRERASGIFVDEVITDEDCNRVRGWLAIAVKQADSLGSQASHDRIEIFSSRLWQRIAVQLCI
jgi:hypothetical protein